MALEGIVERKDPEGGRATFILMRRKDPLLTDGVLFSLGTYCVESHRNMTRKTLLSYDLLHGSPLHQEHSNSGPPGVHFGALSSSLILGRSFHGDGWW